MSRADQVPILDVGAFRETRPETAALDRSVHELHDALRDVGFLYIKNHGIPENLQHRLMTQARRFFAEPESFKMRVAMEKAGRAWRGFFPFGAELTSGRPDQKEGYYFGRELGPDDEDVKRGLPLHGPNLWPPGENFTDFPGTVLDYMTRLEELAQDLMTGIARALGLAPDYFRARFTGRPTVLFRMFNYPRHQAEAAADEWGVREHTDMGFVTILLQDESGGLQVKTRDGRWISAPPVPGTFVVNIGDMLEYWTHGIYRATPHRVRNEAASDRLSLPFFFDPNWDATLEPIDPDSLNPAERRAGEKRLESRWDGLDLHGLGSETTYGDFVWEKVKNVFPHLANSGTP